MPVMCFGGRGRSGERGGTRVGDFFTKNTNLFSFSFLFFFFFLGGGGGGLE